MPAATTVTCAPCRWSYTDPSKRLRDDAAANHADRRHPQKGTPS